MKTRKEIYIQERTQGALEKLEKHASKRKNSETVNNLINEAIVEFAKKLK